jgi:serine/threonine-protein kinase
VLICPRCLARYEDGTTTCLHHSLPLLKIGVGPAKPLVGTIAAERFLLLDMIGSGGMGSIYRAYQLSMSREVAVKILPSTMNDPEYVERFIREARATAQLRSPHTVVVHDFGTLPTGEPFLAMELLSGRSLDFVIRRDERLAPERAQRVIAHSCLSLEEAHGRGMIHRDIKPTNLMLENEGLDTELVKVLDFGLVKVADAVSETGVLTRPGEIHGTPPYMAPEMWSDRFGEVCAGTDIYALGALLFEMLSGTRAFQAKSVPGFLHKHLNDPVPSLFEHRNEPGLAAFDAIIRRCLAKKPEDRYSSARALRMDIMSALSGSVRGIALAETKSERDPATTDKEYAFASTMRRPSSVDTPPQPLAGGAPQQPTVSARPPPAQPAATDSAPATPSAPPIASVPTPVAMMSGPSMPSVPLTPSVLLTPSAMVMPAQIPPGAIIAISQPIAAPQPSRLPMYLGGIALAVIAAGLTFILGVQQGTQRNEVPHPVVSAQTASTARSVAPPLDPSRSLQAKAPEVATHVPTPREPKEKHVSRAPTEASGLVISEPSVLGNLDPANAKEVFASLEPKIRSCSARAPGLTWLTLRVIVLPDGKSKAVRATPNQGEAKHFLECIEPAVLAKSFAPFEGNFSTITAEITR